MYDKYTVYLNDKIHHGYDWAVGELISYDSSGAKIRTSSNDVYIFPSHSIQSMKKRSSW